MPESEVSPRIGGGEQFLQIGIRLGKLCLKRLAAMRHLHDARAVPNAMPMPLRQIGADLFDDFRRQHGRAGGKIERECHDGIGRKLPLFHHESAYVRLRLPDIGHPIRAKKD